MKSDHISVGPLAKMGVGSHTSACEIETEMERERKGRGKEKLPGYF